MRGFHLNHAVEAPQLLGGLLVLYASTSLTWSPAEVLWPATFLLLLVGAFALGARLGSIRGLWLVVLWLLTINLVFTWTEYYILGYQSWPLGYGLAGNPNYFGCGLALGVAAALAYRQWWFLPLAAGGLVFCESRGALFAAGVACLAGLWHSHRATGMIAMLLTVIAASVLKGNAGGTFAARLGVWQDTLNHLSWWGSGFGSFLVAYSGWPVHLNAPPFQNAPHAYNDFLELVFELGIGSALAWAFIAACFEGRNWPDRLICWTFFALSLTYFPLWVVGPLFALSLGHLSQTKGENPWLVGNSNQPITSWWMGPSGSIKRSIARLGSRSARPSTSRPC